MTESSSPGPAHSPAALHDLPATSDERRAAGKAARKRAPRGTLGYWAEEELVRAIAAGAVESLPG